MLKIIIISLTMFLCSATFAQNTPKGVQYAASVVRVSDGDTVVIRADFLPAPLKPELAVRIWGVDTPEKGHRAGCQREAQLAIQATAHTTKLIRGGRDISVVIYGWDKYGGRILGTIVVDGTSVRDSLIANGFAREYYGDAKQSWC